MISVKCKNNIHFVNFDNNNYLLPSISKELSIVFNFAIAKYILRISKLLGVAKFNFVLQYVVFLSIDLL